MSAIGRKADIPDGLARCPLMTLNGHLKFLRFDLSARAERSVPNADSGRIGIDPATVETRRAKNVLPRPAGSLLHPIPNADARILRICSRLAVEPARAIFRTFATGRGGIRTRRERQHYKNHQRS